MRIVTFNDHEIAFYDSILELPIDVESEMRAYELMDIGIGSDGGDLMLHLKKIVDFIASNNNQYAIEEVKNLEMQYLHSTNHYHPDRLAFLCLIKSIDGVNIEDRSQQRLAQLQKQIGFTVEQAESIYLEVKKNFQKN